MRKIFIAATLSLMSFASYGRTANIYVDNRGGGKGVFSSIHSAVKEAERALNKGDVRIVIKGGVYPIPSSIVLPSGSEHHLTIEAEDGADVTLFGGDILDSEWFEPLAEGEFARRLVDGDAKNHIVVCDLRSRGITKWGEITPQAWSKPNENRVAPAILTIAEQRMTLARWPNVGEKSEYLIYRHFLHKERPLKGYELVVQEIIDKVEIPGEVGLLSIVEPGEAYNRNAKTPSQGGTFEVAFDRMKYWNDPTNVFLDGVINSTWEWTYNQIAAVDLANRHITLQESELRPLGEGESVRLPHFHFDNIPEEIDQEGEYYIDRRKGLLYLYAPKDFRSQRVVLATLDEPMFKGSQVNNVTIRGLKIDTGRDLALQLLSASNVIIEDCAISNFVKGGVELRGTQSVVRDSHIYGMGGYGVMVSGGNMKQLNGGANVVSNCEIHDFGWDCKSQMPGVMVDGVGHRVEHCDIYDGTHFGVRLRNVCDVVVEYNKIHNLPTYHYFDGGALYHFSGMSPQMRGNEIRYNYFYDIPTIGIYPDNYTGGGRMYSNIFRNVGNVANRAAINVNGGGECRSYNNIMIDCPLIYNQGRHPSAFVMKKKWQECVEEYGDGRVEKTPYDKYDTFKEWLNDSELRAWLNGEDAAEPKRPYRAKSYLFRNVLYNPNVEIYKSGGDDAVIDRSTRLEMSDNWITRTDPGFVDSEAGDFNLRDDAPIFDKIEGFEAIPFDKIGLKKK